MIRFLNYLEVRAIMEKKQSEILNEKIEKFCKKKPLFGKSKYKKATEAFIKKCGGLQFKNCNYRQGAYFTTKFGYTAYAGKDWDLPGIHKGTDRNHGEIICPFDFPKSGFKDWDGRWWGFDVYLYHPLGFRFRISHMYPGQIKILNKLKNRSAIDANEDIGPTGNNGFSFGAHSHTEPESWGINGEWLETCLALDYILFLKYHDKSFTEFTYFNIIDIARKECKGVKDWTDAMILEDYERLLREKSIVFLNKYKMVIACRNGKLTTLYNSRAVFNM